jgi:carbonic anhydrase
MSTIDELLEANEHYARTFDRGDLALPPARQVAILTCMDARILPSRILSQRLLGTREIAVIHHTDCGMLTFSNRDLREKVKKDLGSDTGEFEFLPFQDLDESVREDVEFLQATQLLNPDTAIRGFVYDVRTGRLREVPIEAARSA